MRSLRFRCGQPWSHTSPGNVTKHGIAKRRSLGPTPPLRHKTDAAARHCCVRCRLAIGRFARQTAPTIAAVLVSVAS
jgi:hypothetical protein